MTLRGIVVGCGGMGKHWMKTVKENSRVELVGVVDIRQDAAEKAAAEFGLPADRAFVTVNAAIKALKPDFVCDITIPEAHAPTTIAAHRLGVPTIGEKPLADSLPAARRMVAAAKKSRKLAMVSQSRRYDGNHSALREIIATQRIGSVTTLNCAFYLGAHFGGFRDAMDSPLILDMSIHHFDLARYFTGLDPVAVYCREFNPKGSWYKGDVACTAVFEMTKGVIFTYSGSWCSEGCHTSWNGDWRIIGDQGTMLYEHDKAPTGQRLKPQGKPGFHSELEDIVTTPTKPAAGEGIAGALNEFIDGLLSKGKQRPQCLLADNYKSLAMVFAAIESSRTGKRIKIKV